MLRERSADPLLLTVCSLSYSIRPTHSYINSYKFIGYILFNDNSPAAVLHDVHAIVAQDPSIKNAKILMKLHRIQTNSNNFVNNALEYCKNNAKVLLSTREIEAAKILHEWFRTNFICTFDFFEWFSLNHPLDFTQGIICFPCFWYPDEKITMLPSEILKYFQEEQKKRITLASLWKSRKLSSFDEFMDQIQGSLVKYKSSWRRIDSMMARKDHSSRLMCESLSISPKGKVFRDWIFGEFCFIVEGLKADLAEHFIYCSYLLQVVRNISRYEQVTSKLNLGFNAKLLLFRAFSDPFFVDKKKKSLKQRHFFDIRCAKNSFTRIRPLLIPEGFTDHSFSINHPEYLPLFSNVSVVPRFFDHVSLVRIGNRVYSFVVAELLYILHSSWNAEELTKLRLTFRDPTVKSILASTMNLSEICLLKVADKLECSETTENANQIGTLSNHLLSLFTVIFYNQGQLASVEFLKSLFVSSCSKLIASDQLQPDLRAQVKLLKAFISTSRIIPASKQTRKVSKKNLSHALEDVYQKLTELQDNIGLFFEDEFLLLNALVSQSYAESHDINFDNDRLEYLGDALLDELIAEFLSLFGEDLSVAQFEIIRMDVVSNESLIRISDDWKLRNYLPLDYKISRDSKTKKIADAFEAIVASIYLDQGLLASRLFVFRSFAPTIAKRLNDPRFKRGTTTLEVLVLKLESVLGKIHEKSIEYRFQHLPDNPGVVQSHVVLNVSTIISEGYGVSKLDAQEAAAWGAVVSLIAKHGAMLFSC